MQQPLLRRGLITLMLAHFALGVVFSLVVPIWEAYDEPGHYAYVQYVANHFGLPPAGSPVSKNFNEGIQPPLYYLVLGFSTFWLHPREQPVIERNPLQAPFHGIPQGGLNIAVHGDDEAFPFHGVALAVHAGRIMSVLLGTFAVWFTFCLARLVFPGRPILTLAATAVHAFWPQFLFMSSVINNDGLAVTWAALALWTTLRLVLQPVRARDLLWPVLALGAGALTKLSVVALAPLVVVGLGAALWKLMAGLPKRSVWRLLAVSAAALGLGGTGLWFYLRDLMQRQTSNVPLNEVLESLGKFVADPFAPYFGWGLLPAALAHGFFSFWASFGWGNVPVEDGVYTFAAWLSLIGLLGLAIFLVRGTRAQRISLVFLLAAVVSVVGATTYLALFLRDVNVLAGRYMLTALPAVSILLTAGVAYWFPRRWQDPGAVLLGLGLMAWSALIPFHTIMPAYAPPQLLPESALSDVPNRMQANFGDELELVGYQLSADSVTTGGVLPVTLYWRALKPMSVDYFVAVHLISIDGHPVDGLDLFPGNGSYATSLWKPGTIIPDHYDVPVRVDIAEPAGGALVVSVYQTQGKNEQIPLKIAQPSGPAHTAATFGRFRLLPLSPPAAKPSVHVQFQLGDEIQLIGYDAERDGPSARVRLYWQALRQPEHDYTRFVHAADSREALLAQQDSQPQGGLFPTGLWRAGDVVVDEVALPLGAAATGQPLHLWVGMYQLENLERLPVFDASGSHVPDDRIPIPLP